MNTVIPNTTTTTTTATNNNNIPPNTAAATQETVNASGPRTNKNHDTNIINPDQLVSIEDQNQYKVQLLLHINSVLLARVIHLSNVTNNNNNNTAMPEPIQRLISQSLKRVHANLQCISQINQGVTHAKPLIMDPPETPNNNNNSSDPNTHHGPPQDILTKLYILMSRIFEFW